jgi:hypothetical protein
MDPDFLERKRRYKQEILNVLEDWPQQFIAPAKSVARPAGSYGPLQRNECWSPVPTHPDDADVDANKREAGDMWPNPFAFRDAVRNRGRWDYKQRASQYENLGNFNYGAAGTAWGFSADTLKSQAGRAQMAAGTSKREWQKYGGRNNSRMLPPYGDDPVDQEWIQRGIDHAKSGGKMGVTCR